MADVSFSSFEYLLSEALAYACEQEEEAEERGHKVEKMGYNVGYRFMERIARGSVIGPEPLDKVKFLCRSFWTAIFDKSISRLQTNQKDFFVLTDNEFAWIQTYLTSAQLGEQKDQKDQRDQRDQKETTLSGDGETEAESVLFASSSASPLSLQLFLYAQFITGLVSGALENLGLSVKVVTDSSAPPAFSINVRLRRNI